MMVLMYHDSSFSFITTLLPHDIRSIYDERFNDHAHDADDQCLMTCLRRSMAAYLAMIFIPIPLFFFLLSLHSDILLIFFLIDWLVTSPGDSCYDHVRLPRLGWILLCLRRLRRPHQEGVPRMGEDE